MTSRRCAHATRAHRHLDVREGAAQADVFAALAAHGVRFEVVHGGINDIGGRVFGHLTLAVTARRMPWIALSRRHPPR
jgi:ABC-type methionine transport system ATPase subunit